MRLFFFKAAAFLIRKRKIIVGGRDSWNILCVICPFHQRIQLGFIVDVSIAHMQALPALIFFRLVALFLQKLALPAVVAVLQLGLSDHLEFHSFLHLLCLP